MELDRALVIRRPEPNTQTALDQSCRGGGKVRQHECMCQWGDLCFVTTDRRTGYQLTWTM